MRRIRREREKRIQREKERMERDEALWRSVKGKWIAQVEELEVERNRTGVLVLSHLSIIGDFRVGGTWP